MRCSSLDQLQNPKLVSAEIVEVSVRPYNTSTVLSAAALESNKGSSRDVLNLDNSSMSRKVSNRTNAPKLMPTKATVLPADNLSAIRCSSIVEVHGSSRGSNVLESELRLIIRTVLVLDALPLLVLVKVGLPSDAGSAVGRAGKAIFEIDGGAGCEVDKSYGFAFEIVSAYHGHVDDFASGLI